MVRAPAELVSLRFSRSEKERLLAALFVSFCLHLAVWGLYVGEKRTGWWDKVFHSSRPKVLAKMTPPPVVQKTDPVIFIEVNDPATEPPQQAKFYSDQNSRAANPEATQETSQPKLTGDQTVVPKIEAVPKPVLAKPAPSTPPTPPPVAPKPAETQPTPSAPAPVVKPVEPVQTPANTLMPGAGEKAKPEEKPAPTPSPSDAQAIQTQPAPAPRPRTLAQARQMAGQPLQQDGGVKRHALKSSLDALATPFGAYDRAVIEAVQDRWYALLDSQQFASDRTGMVTVFFHLNADGSVTEMKITKNTVGELLGYVCMNAIQQAAPFGAWPPDMRRMIGANFREITFTFYYY